MAKKVKWEGDRARGYNEGELREGAITMVYEHDPPVVLQPGQRYEETHEMTNLGNKAARLLRTTLVIHCEET